MRGVMRTWIQYRIKEGRGFLAKRLLYITVIQYEILYGECFIKLHNEKVWQIFNPEDVRIRKETV